MQGKYLIFKESEANKWQLHEICHCGAVCLSLIWTPCLKRRFCWGKIKILSNICKADTVSRGAWLNIDYWYWLNIVENCSIIHLWYWILKYLIRYCAIIHSKCWILKYLIKYCRQLVNNSLVMLQNFAPLKSQSETSLDI